MAEPQNTSTRTRSHSRVHLRLQAGLYVGGRRVRPLGLAFGAALMLAACSGESDAASVPTVQLEPTTSTTVAPTTTSTEATTTTEDPTVAYERDVAEITAVYDQLLSYHVTYGLTSNRAAMAKFATNPLLDRKNENFKAWEEQGFRIGEQDYDFRILDVSFDGDYAIAISCNLDASSMLTADGQIVIPADVDRHLRETEFERLAEGWRVTETGHAGGELTLCDI